MKKIFIAYADAKMSYSLKRIGSQAKSLGIFDDVILYTPDDLPDYAKKAHLMTYSYGGGYWCWKPVIIYETLQKYEEGTVVCYVDAGCTLRQGIEWKLFWEFMKKYSGICFKYSDVMPSWGRFGSTSTKIKHWTKKKSLLFLDSYVGTQEYREDNKVMGGILLFKGRENPLVKDWLNISINHPQIIIDPDVEEMADQYDFFAQHKHDQSVLTALAHKYQDNVLVLPELFETSGNKVAIVASRIRCKTRWDYVIFQLKTMLRRILRDDVISFIKAHTK